MIITKFRVNPFKKKVIHFTHYPLTLLRQKWSTLPITLRSTVSPACNGQEQQEDQKYEGDDILVTCLHFLRKKTENVRITWHGEAFVRLLPWKSSKYYILWVCVGSIKYPACNAHAPYFNLLSARLYNKFSVLSHKRHYFREQNVIQQKTCLDFLYNFCLKYFSF